MDLLKIYYNDGKQVKIDLNKLKKACEVFSDDFYYMESDDFLESLNQSIFKNVEYYTVESDGEKMIPDKFFSYSYYQNNLYDFLYTYLSLEYWDDILLTLSVNDEGQIDLNELVDIVTAGDYEIIGDYDLTTRGEELFNEILATYKEAESFLYDYRDYIKIDYKDFFEVYIGDNNNYIYATDLDGYFHYFN